MIPDHVRLSVDEIESKLGTSWWFQSARGQMKTTPDEANKQFKAAFGNLDLLRPASAWWPR